MSILIVALDFKPMNVGIAEYIYQIAKHLQLMGEKIIVLSQKMEGGEKFY